MADQDDLDEDLFADLWALIIFIWMRHHLTSLFSYENEEAPAKPTEPQPTQPTQPPPQNLPSVPQQDTPAQSIEHVPTADSNSNSNPTFKQEQNDDDESRVYGENIYGDSNGAQGMQNQGYDAAVNHIYISI